MTRPLATLEDVDFRYGAHWALDRVSLELPPGKLTVLLGPNGAGKTTLVKLLLGICRPAAGSVRVLGGDPTQLAVRRHISTMLQISGVPEKLTVAELVELFASFYPEPLKRDEALALAEIEDIAGRRFEALSGGQRQRTLLALALVARARLLILDEPGSGLDPASRRRLGCIIRQRVEAGVGVLMCTHDLEEAGRLADRVIVLNHGQVAHDGSTESLQELVPDRRVRCRTGLDDEALKALPGSRLVERDGPRCDILVDDATSFLRALLDVDPRVDELEVGGASLEAAFRSLVDAPASREAA